MFAEDGSRSVVFGLAKYQDVPSFIDHHQRTPFRANHVEDMLTLGRAAAGGILPTPDQYKAPPLLSQSHQSPAPTAKEPLQRSGSRESSMNGRFDRRKSLSMESGLDLIAENATRLTQIAAAAGHQTDLNHASSISTANTNDTTAADVNASPSSSSLGGGGPGPDAFYQQQIEAQMARLKQLQDTKSTLAQQRHSGDGAEQYMNLAQATGHGAGGGHGGRGGGEALYMNTAHRVQQSRGSSTKSAASAGSSVHGSSMKSVTSATSAGSSVGGGLRQSTESGNVYMNAQNNPDAQYMNYTATGAMINTDVRRGSDRRMQQHEDFPPNAMPLQLPGRRTRSLEQKPSPRAAAAAAAVGGGDVYEEIEESPAAARRLSRGSGDRAGPQPGHRTTVPVPSSQAGMLPLSLHESPKMRRSKASTVSGAAAPQYAVSPDSNASMLSTSTVSRPSPSPRPTPRPRARTGGSAHTSPAPAASPAPAVKVWTGGAPPPPPPPEEGPEQVPVPRHPSSPVIKPRPRRTPSDSPLAATSSAAAAAAEAASQSPGGFDNVFVPSSSSPSSSQNQPRVPAPRPSPRPRPAVRRGVSLDANTTGAESGGNLSSSNPESGGGGVRESLRSQSSTAALPLPQKGKKKKPAFSKGMSQ